MLSLHSYIAGQERPLRRIVANAGDTEQIFQLDLGCREIIQQLRSCVCPGIAGVDHFPKAWREIDVNSFFPENGINRRPIELRKLPKLAHAHPALTLLNGD